MRKSAMLKCVPTYMLFVAVILIGTGCDHDRGETGAKTPQYPHNLQDQDCQRHVGKPFRIEVVANKQIFKNPNDTIVYVCPDDTLSWFINDKSYTIEIKFTDSYKYDLFGGGNANFSSNPGGNNNQGGNNQNETPGKKVISQSAHERRAYKYSISLDDGKNHFQLDPHVIPM